MDATEAGLRAAVIAEARTWLGTPFAHRSMVKGGGVDCAQLVRLSYIAAGVLPEWVDPGVYASQWHLHRDEERYLAWGHYLGIEVAEPRPADVAIWQFGRVYSHAGIIIDAEHVVHAFEPNREVTIDLVRMGALSTMLDLAKGRNGGGVPRPVKYFDLICPEAYAKRAALTAPGAAAG
jgi:cell wall-associated NlpC family hydrolase